LILGSLAGCASPNAILEVTIDLPARPVDATGKVFAFAQFRGDEVPFEDSWPGDPRDYPGTELTESPQTVEYSVISEDDTIGVHLKIRFCEGPTTEAASCTEQDELMMDSGAEWFAIEHPFYMSERTEWSKVIAAVPVVRPAEESVVVKCDVKGCVDALGADFFCRSDGTHFCE